MSCPSVVFTAVWDTVSSIQMDWAVDPPFSGDCLFHWQVQEAGGDWSVIIDQGTSAFSVDEQFSNVGDGIFDVRGRVECFGTDFCPWSTVEDVTVG